MKKLLNTLLVFSSIAIADTSIYNLVEEARLQNYKNIDNKLDYIDLNINPEKMLLKFNKYIKRNKIKVIDEKILEDENKILNNEFVYKNKTYKYSKFLKDLPYNLPSKKRLLLTKELTLEEADYIVFKELVEDKLKKECVIIEEKRKEELKKYLEQKRRPELFKSQIKNCRYNDLTINGKKQLFKNIEKAAFKELYLQKLYLTKAKTITELEDELSFYKSNKYQEAFKERLKIIRNIFSNRKISNKKEEKTIKKKLDTSSQKVEYKSDKDEDMSFLKG